MGSWHLFLGVEGLVRTVVLHFKFMTTLVCYGRNHGSVVIIRKVDLRHLHRAIYTSSHVLRNCVFTYYVVRVQNELVLVVRVVSYQARHVHRQLRIRLLLLDFHHLVIVHRANVLHLLVVLHRLFDRWEVEHLVVRAHRVVRAPVVTVDHHFQFRKLLSTMALGMNFFLIKFLRLFHGFLVEESLSRILNGLHLCWDANATNDFDVTRIIAISS